MRMTLECIISNLAKSQDFIITNLEFFISYCIALQSFVGIHPSLKTSILNWILYHQLASGLQSGVDFESFFYTPQVCSEMDKRVM